VTPKLLLPFVVYAVLVSGCNRQESKSDVRSAIQRQLNRSVQATREKDIATYMDCIPKDFALKDEQRGTISHEELRKNILRDWSIITRTLAIETKIDSLEVRGREATAF